MDLVNLGGKLLSSVKSSKTFNALAASGRPEVPERAAAAAAVARTLAGLPPHERLSLASTSLGSASVYGGWLHHEKLEDLEAVFFEQGFDPVRYLLEKLNNQDVDIKYIEAQVAQKLLQLDVITEKLSKKVMEHHEEMVNGMQLVTELEKDLQVSTIISKNGKRCLSSAMHEVSQDLVVTSNVKKKHVLMDLLPLLGKIQHAMDIKARLESIVDEGNYAKALQMCSLCMQLMEECSGITAVLDMHHSIDEWLQRTMVKVDAVLQETCCKFNADNFMTVIDAYSMIDDNALGEKIQNIFVQIIVSETHTVLRELLYEGEDPTLIQRKSRIPYNDLCLQIPESKIRLCLHRTLEILFDLLCSYYAMMTWRLPYMETEGASAIDKRISSLSNGKHKRSGSDGSMPVPITHSKHGRTSSLSLLEPQPGSPSCSPLGKEQMSKDNAPIIVDLPIDRKYDDQTCCGLMSETDEEGKDVCVLDSRDLEKDMEEVIVGGSLIDVVARMRRETVINVSKSLEKGRKHVWELSARRVSTLLSADAVCATSPHQFLQSLDWINRFVLAGEAFSGSEAISLRAKLVKLSEKYFGAFHRHNLEVLRMMLEKESWQQLSPDAIRGVSLAGLMGDGAPILVSTQEGSPKIAERVMDQVHPGVVGSSKVSEDSRAGFGFWLERGNPFSEKKHHPISAMPTDLNSEAVETNALVNGPQNVETVDGVQNGASKGHSGLSDDKDDEENEDLLADFIDEDSQLPSRVYSSFQSVSSGPTKSTGKYSNEDLIITGSAASILRYMDKYARLMQILQPISSEVFRGFCQLFELYFYYIFKSFGQRDTFGTGRGQFESSNLNTARLRTTLVRISQGLEDQRSKASSGNVQGAPNVHNGLESSQISSVQGSPGLSISPANLFGLKERCVAVESLALIAETLKKSKARLQSVLPQDSLASLENFLSRTVEVVPDLREHTYKNVARLLLNIGSYVDRIANVRWELKELGMEHNGYVDLLLGEFKHFATRLARVGISKENQELFLEYGVDVLSEVILEGISRAKKCTNEGRALMSLDLQVLINGLRHLAPQRLASNLHIVETYIKAFYLPETEYPYWVRSHPEYSKAQMISLITLVAASNNWKRKSRTELIERIEAGEF